MNSYCAAGAVAGGCCVVQPYKTYNRPQKSERADRLLTGHEPMSANFDQQHKTETVSLHRSPSSNIYGVIICNNVAKDKQSRNLTGVDYVLGNKVSTHLKKLRTVTVIQGLIRVKISKSKPTLKGSRILLEHIVKGGGIRVD